MMLFTINAANAQIFTSIEVFPFLFLLTQYTVITRNSITAEDATAEPALMPAM